MVDIDRQRAMTIEALSAESQAMVDTTVETPAEVEKLRRRLIVDGFAEGRGLVDYLVWRLALVFGAGLAIGGALLWAIMRPRARRAAAST